MTRISWMQKIYFNTFRDTGHFNLIIQELIGTINIVNV